MKALLKTGATTASLVVLLLTSTGCESTGGGSSVHTGVYYGVGFYDPWYYGDYDGDVDIIVEPPDRPSRPNRPESPVRPSHPIATPPTARPTPRPTPSIPSAPRPAARGGGRR